MPGLNDDTSKLEQLKKLGGKALFNYISAPLMGYIEDILKNIINNNPNTPEAKYLHDYINSTDFTADNIVNGLNEMNTQWSNHPDAPKHYTTIHLTVTHNMLKTGSDWMVSPVILKFFSLMPSIYNDCAFAPQTNSFIKCMTNIANLYKNNKKDIKLHNISWFINTLPKIPYQHNAQIEQSVANTLISKDALLQNKPAIASIQNTTNDHIIFSDTNPPAYDKLANVKTEEDILPLYKDINANAIIAADYIIYIDQLVGVYKSDLTNWAANQNEGEKQQICIQLLEKLKNFIQERYGIDMNQFIKIPDVNNFLPTSTKPLEDTQGDNDDDTSSTLSSTSAAQSVTLPPTPPPTPPPTWQDKYVNEPKCLPQRKYDVKRLPTINEDNKHISMPKLQSGTNLPPATSINNTQNSNKTKPQTQRIEVNKQKNPKTRNDNTKNIKKPPNPTEKRAEEIASAYAPMLKTFQRNILNNTTKQPKINTPTTNNAGVKRLSKLQNHTYQASIERTSQKKEKPVGKLTSDQWKHIARTSQYKEECKKNIELNNSIHKFQVPVNCVY